MMKDLSRRSFLQNSGIGVGTTAIAVTLPSFINISKTKTSNEDGKRLNIAFCSLRQYTVAGIVRGTPIKAAGKKRYNIFQKNIYNYGNFDEMANNKDIDFISVVLPKFNAQRV